MSRSKPDALVSIYSEKKPKISCYLLINVYPKFVPSVNRPCSQYAKCGTMGRTLQDGQEVAVNPSNDCVKLYVEAVCHC